MFFGEYSIDLTALELRRGGARVELAPQAVRLLILLVERRGELVARQALYDSLWPEGSDVDVDRALNTLIRQIRLALGDDPASPRYIRTYPRRGYRFLAAPTLPPLRVREVPARSRRWARLRRVALMSSLLAVLAIAARRVLPPRDPDSSVPSSAREAFELGKHLLQSPTISRRAEALPYLREAVRRAQGSARVRAHLADALLWADRGAEAHAEARRALTLGANEPHALFISGVLALTRDWDWPRSEHLLRRAASRDRESPVYPIILAFALTTAGRAQEALPLLDRARAKNAVSAILSADIGLMYFYAGHMPKAADACEQAMRLAPEATYARECALAARMALGDRDAARTHAVALVAMMGGERSVVLGDESAPADSVIERYRRWQADRARTRMHNAPFDAALALAQAGHVAEALDALRQAAAKRDMGFITVTVDPRLAALRADPVFRQLAAPLVANGAAALRS